MTSAEKPRVSCDVCGKHIKEGEGRYQLVGQGGFLASVHVECHDKAKEQ
jgi:hypothetical protein